MKRVTLHAQVRDEQGKGASRRLRSGGFVPAVFYGYKSNPRILKVNAAEFVNLLSRDKKESIFVNLLIQDKDGENKKLSVIKELQVNSLRKKLIHADFYEIDLNRELTTEIPVVLKGTPVGFEKGGELQHLKRDIRVSALPDKLPEIIEVDVSLLDVGDSIKVVDVAVPEGVKVLDHGDVALAAVALTRVSLSGGEASAEAASEGAEPAAEPEE
ncbi:MAG: 50S ribosomal protein L25 [Deltaproteobacteria bacterium]|nr:50S ribosomal protein L25 [Deltaproteobacteria bacterium]